MNARMNRRSLLGVVLALGVAATGGCLGTGGGTAGGTAGTKAASKAPQSPRDQLMAALPSDTGPSFEYRVDDLELPYTGVVQPGDRSYTIGIRQKDRDLGFTMRMDFLVVDTRAWMKVGFSGTEGLTGLPKLPKTWMLLDPKKLDREKAGGEEAFPLAYGGDTDPGNAAAVFRSIVDVRETGPGRFAGTVDLTREPEADIADAKRIKALGEKARSVPFQAVVDAAGRLTSTIVDIPAAGRSKAAKYTITYRSFGSAAKVTEPAPDEQRPAPAEAYRMLQG